MEILYGYHKIKYLKDAEVRRCIARAGDKAFMLEMIYFLGLRRAEVGGILRGDVRDGGVVIRPLKRKDSPEILMPLSKNLYRACLQRLEQHDKGYLFPGYKGKGISGQGVDKIWRSVCPEHGPHILRHSCAMRLVELGFKPEEIKDWLRQKTLNATSFYITSSSQKFVSMAKAMSR